MLTVLHLTDVQYGIADIPVEASLSPSFYLKNRLIAATFSRAAAQLLHRHCSSKSSLETAVQLHTYALYCSVPLP